MERVLWASAALMGVFTLVDADLPVTCEWCRVVIQGCADDNFSFRDTVGWEMLKREYSACLYVRLNNFDNDKNCQDLDTLDKAVDCKAEAYANARADQKQKESEEGVRNFKACVSSTFRKYKRATIETRSEYRLDGLERRTQVKSGGKPNITIEYTHYI